MRPNTFPNRVVILGGGSAGWMSAAYLDRTFNLPDRKRLDIVLVESPAIGRIGVGEATIPTLRDFTAFIGIDEPTLMKRCNATFKHGVRFIDWNGPGTEYFHAFEAIESFRGLNPAPSWLARRAANVAAPFDEESGIQKRIAYAGLAPKRMVDPDFGGALPYAYHLDAEAFGDLLAEVAIKRGVRHVEGRVVEVEHGDDGDIAALRLDDGQTIAGDLFIDCSGFASVLLGKALATPFIDFGQHLLCDRAIAIPEPYREGAAPNSYTTAQALTSGWMWRIGLQSREGIGYVYSSAFIEPEAAERELRAAAGIGDTTPARHLDMRVGMPAVSWNRNVIGIGLAGGFIEPLESTGLHLCEIALANLVRYFPLSGINPAARDRFNLLMEQRYLELRDFIVGHYCATKRDDSPFWREVRKAERIPESVQTRLALWQDLHPSSEDNDATRLIFSHTNWQAVLYGLEAEGKAARENAAQWCPQPGSYLPELQRAYELLRKELAPQRLFLKGLATIPAREGGW